MDNKVKPRKWNKVKVWVSKYHQIIWVTCSLFIIALSGFLSVNIISNHKSTVLADISSDETVEQKIIEAPKYYSLLTGKQLDTEAQITAPVTGVMIENSPDARPQSGLKNSGVVFEAIAEGGITRFLVLYQDQKPQLIGPVRSLRLYDIDWAVPFNTSIAHVGGSAAALTEVRNGSYRDIDQFFNSNYYWRSTDRYTPHNVYTSFAKLDTLNSSKGYTSSSIKGFTRTNEGAAETPTATNINVVISSDTYNSSYVYNKTTNSYDRSQAGEAHIDREDGQISPSVVVVMEVQESTVFEDGWREKITTVGSGNVTIFQNGIVKTGTWTKNSTDSQITFKDASGNEIGLAVGQTWITAIPSGKGSVSWQ